MACSGPHFGRAARALRRVAIHGLDLADLAGVILEVQRVHSHPAPAIQLPKAPVGIKGIEPLVAFDVVDGRSESLVALPDDVDQLRQLARLDALQRVGDNLEQRAGILIKVQPGFLKVGDGPFSLKPLLVALGQTAQDDYWNRRCSRFFGFTGTS